MSNGTRITVSDAAAPTDSSHVAQDSSKPQGSATRPSESDREFAAENPIDADDKADKTVNKEYGGQAGPEPTRYGDWEKKGRVTDF